MTSGRGSCRSAPFGKDQRGGATVANDVLGLGDLFRHGCCCCLLLLASDAELLLLLDGLRLDPAVRIGRVLLRLLSLRLFLDLCLLGNLLLLLLGLFLLDRLRGGLLLGLLLRLGLVVGAGGRGEREQMRR